MNKQLRWVCNNFYIFFCFFTYLAARGLSLPLVPMLLVIVSLYFPVVFIKTNKKTNKGNVLLLTLGAYILFSIVFYFINGYPLEIYFNGLYIYCYPVVFFYIATQSKPFDKEQFYERTLIALMITYVIGLYFYFFTPSWYMEWRVKQLSSWLGDNANNYLESSVTLSSFFGTSYFVGYTSFWALSYLLHKLYENREVKFLTHIELLLTILVMTLSQIRASFVLGVIMIVVYSILEVRKGKSLRITYYLIIIVLIALYLFFKYFDELSFLIGRYLTVFDGSLMNDGRDEQWKSVYVSFHNYIFGEGFNIVGHEARSYSMPSIADGEIFKVLYELGIVGALLFYMFCIKTITRAFTHVKDYAVEIPVLIGFIAMQYGANPFGMTNIIILFWFSAGLVWNRRIITERTY